MNLSIAQDTDRSAAIVLRDGRVEVALDELQASGALEILAEALGDAALARLVESSPRPRFGPDRQAWDDDQELVARLGAELASMLLGDPAFEAFRQRFAERPPRRLRIVSDEPRLLGAPWELVTLGTDSQARTLAEHCEILRVPLVGAEPNLNTSPLPLAARHGSELRVVIVSPRPAGPDDVPMQPAVGPVLGTTLAFPGRVRLVVVRPPTLTALEHEISRRGPFDIVHFDGHGRPDASGDTELVFEDESEREAPVDAQTFAAVVAAADPWLVVLNACRSASTGWGSTPTPSFAATLCQRLPGVRVIAMRYAVSVDFVEALVSSFYPLLVAGVSVGEAIRTTNVRLARAWRTGANVAAPLFVNLTVWASPALADDGDSNTHSAEVPDVPPIDWRRGAPALFWADEIEALHRALDADRQILVAGTLGSAASEIVHLFAEYAKATGAFEQCVVEFSDDSLATPDQTLHVVVVGPGGDRARAIGECARLLDGKPHSAAIVAVTDGRPELNAIHVGDHMVPTDLIATQLRSTLNGHNPFADDADAGRAWELIRICQDDIAALRALSGCESFEQAAEMLEHLRWGADLSKFAAAESLRGALATLSEEQANLVSLVGLSGGGLIYREMLSLVTTGGVKDTSFIDVLGRLVEAAEWDHALHAAAGVGLFRLLDGLATSPAVLVTPLQALALRERLSTWTGKENLTRLQRAYAVGAIAFSVGFDKAFLQGGTAIHDNFLAAGDGLLARALELGLRDQDDDLSAKALHQLLVRPVEGSPASPAHLQGCEALAAIYSMDRLPDFRASLLAWRARDAIDRERWSDAFVHVEAALAIEGARWRYMPKAYVEIMKSRTLWRTARTAEAETTLADAARSAGPSEAGVVASACADFAQYLHLNAEQTERLRERVGAPREPPSLLRQAIAAEEEGHYGDAYALWVASLRDRQIQGSPTSRALALEDLGRFCAVHGSHEDATYWLRHRLERGAELGLGPEKPLYYLGLSAERAGELDESGSWLKDALAAAQASRDERMEADCLYELALVAAQPDDAMPGAGRRELLDALRIFERVGPPVHVGDCWLLLAQIEAGAKDMTVAWAAANHMTSIYRACDADPERLAKAELVIALLGDR